MEAGFLTWIMTTPYGPYVTAVSLALTGLVMVASAIVPFTPTPKDDEALAKIKELLGRFSLFGFKETK